jgi:very-short-patch-repair endonuclease
MLDFKRDFAYYCQDGIITQEEWDTLAKSAANNGLALDKALVYIRPEAVNFISRTIDLAAEDGFISYDEERNVKYLIELLALPAELAAPLQQRLNWLKILTQIRQGELPNVTPHLSLTPGEIAHFEIEAFVEGQPDEAGWLVATNRRLVFAGKMTNFATELKNIQGISASSNQLNLQMEPPRTGRSFRLGDALMVKTALEVLVKANRRAALAEAAGSLAKPEVKTHQGITAGEPEKSIASNGKNSNHAPSPIEQVFFETWKIYNQRQPVAIDLVSEHKVLEGKYSLDFAHLPTQIAIELDGFQAHSSTEQIAKDRRREREVRNAGWEFIRFGGKEIHRNVYGCVVETYDYIYKRISDDPAKFFEEVKKEPLLNLASNENTEYKPAKLKLLFIEEFRLNKSGKGFYSANSTLFFRTREVFSEVFKNEWQTPAEFLRFFQQQGCYMLALNDLAGDAILTPEALDKRRNAGVAVLAKHLNAAKPENVVVIMGSLTPYVRKALIGAGSKNIPLEVLPFPGKDYQASYREKLVKLLTKIYAL